MTPDLYTRFYLWMVSHRRLVLIVTFLATVAGIGISSRIELEEDILDILPHNDQRVDEYRYALRKFRQIDRLYIDVGINRADADTLALAADEFYSALSTNKSFDRVMYRFEMGGQQKVVNYLTGALPNLFTEADARALEPKLEPAAIREYLTVMRRKLAGPEGMVLKDVVAADPVGMSALVVNKVLPLQTGFGEGQIVDGRITSADGRHVLMMAEPNFPSSDSKHSEVLVRDLEQLAATVEKQFPGVHVAITGGHRMSVDNATLIKTDATRCIFLGMGAMLVLCLTAFRRRWLALIAFLPSLFGSTMAGIVLAIWQPHLSAIATGFAVIAVGITVDYAIHVIYHLDNAAGLNQFSLGRHVGRLVLPVGVGALTTVAAFVVMMFSPMHGYQQLGLFGTVGVLFSAAFALTILPLLIPVPNQSSQPPLWLTRIMDRFHGAQTKGRLWMLLGLVALTVVTVFGVKRLRFDGDLARLNGITAETKNDDELIRNTWGDAMGMTLVVARGATPDEALAKSDRAAQTLAQQPGVSGVYSLASVCPSRATQEANIQRWQAFWSAERQATFRAGLTNVARELGFRADAFETFWRRVQQPPALLALEDFRGTPLEQVLTERVVLGTNDSAISTLVKLDDRANVPKLRAALPDMMVLDHKDFVTHIAGLAKDGLGQFAWWTGLVVTVLIYLSLASVELVFATMLPIAFALLWTFGTMGWLGLPVDMMNSIFVIFIIGIGEDYSLFLVTSKLDEWRGQPDRLGATSASILISALTTLFGFAVLVFAKHPVLFSMGTTVLIGMGFAFLATIALTPLCMDLLLFNAPPRGGPRWWHLLGTVWATIHVGASEVFLYYVLRPILKVTSPRTADEMLRRATRSAGRMVVNWLPFGRLDMQNISAATFSPPCIVISNHQSAVDVLVMVAMPGDVRQTPKKRVFDSPLLGIGCKLAGHVMVEPNDPVTTLRRCREKLAEGASVHFYPEGTRSVDGWVQRFHRGAFELAVQLKQDILPIVLCDTNTAMPRDAYWFEPYHVTVRALPRITPQNFDYSLGVLALMRHCETIVRDGLQRQLDEVNTPRVVRRKVERLYRYQGKFVEQFVHWKMKMDPMFPALDALVPRHGFILDLGCGYGVVTHWLAAYTDTRTFLGIDYDEEKIRVAQRSAHEHRRIRFEAGDILNRELPACDAVLLLDVLHYWQPEKQQQILNRVRQTLRPGGRLILRDAARAESDGHRQIDFWERIATRTGHNKTVEGLHFLTLEELEGMLKAAGFARWEIKREAGRGSNLLLLASVSELPQCSGA
ncbi:MAG: MMPL family transporter [Verrucomicrobia bacterium]|nr:MMPL family transporter [Verrucomicrobiota bacterium]